MCVFCILFCFLSIFSSHLVTPKILKKKKLLYWNRKPCSYTIVPFCSKSHQDLFYTFKEFNSLIKKTVAIVPKSNQHKQIPIMKIDRRMTCFAHASSMSLPLPTKTNKKSKQYIQYSPYDTLV